MDTSTALAVHRANAALTPAQKDEYWKEAVTLIKSGLFPKKFNGSPEQAYLCALYGHELGMSAQESWAKIHMIEGQPTLSVHLQVAKAREAIPNLIWKIVEHNSEICVIEHGRTKDDLQRTDFTINEAKAANLTSKNNWRNDTKAMLYARAAGRAIRWFYPETQRGGIVYNTEELSDALTGQASGAGPAPGLEQAKSGEGRMPKAQKPRVKVETQIEDAEVLPRAPDEPKAPEVKPTEPEDIDEDAVLDLVEILSQTADPNQIDRLYGDWRGAGQRSAATLIKGFDAKEARMRTIHTTLNK